MQAEDCDGPVTLADALASLVVCDDVILGAQECDSHPDGAGRSSALAERVETCGAEGVSL